MSQYLTKEETEAVQGQVDAEGHWEDTEGPLSQWLSCCNALSICQSTCSGGERGMGILRAGKSQEEVPGTVWAHMLASRTHLLSHCCELSCVSGRTTSPAQSHVHILFVHVCTYVRVHE